MSAEVPYAGKRILDLALCAVLAVPAALLSGVAAFAVRATSAGPILFRQKRVGRDGEIFECLKFRTMIDGDNPLIPDTAYITAAGRWLRRTSLDELPQLLNVARGDMSIVGPRPMLPFQYQICDENQRRRFTVRPGLTGWAQVHGRNALGWPARIELDIEYVERQSVVLDLRILAASVVAVISGSGVDGHSPDDPFAAPRESTDRE